MHAALNHCNNQSSLLLSFSSHGKNKPVYEFLKQYNLSFFTVHSYNSGTTSIAAPLSIQDSGSTENNIWIKANLPPLHPEDNILVIEMEETSGKGVEIRDFSIPKILSGKIALYEKEYNAPVLTNYLLTSKTYSLQSFCQESDSHKAIFYKPNDLPALPPMITSQTHPTLVPDSTFILKKNTMFSFTREGFIKIYSENSDSLWFLVKNKNYPKISSVEEMIEPLIYITSDTEYQKMYSHPNLKVALDSFWLSIGGNKEYTRKLIRSYYERVEFANASFTTFKEGWKTDKGMIYLLFGSPDEVFKYNTREEWIYNFDPKSPIVFIFKSSEHSPSYGFTELDRRPEYKGIWLQTVEKIRNGSIVK